MTTPHDDGCLCFFCREGDPDGPNPPSSEVEEDDDQEGEVHDG